MNRGALIRFLSVWPTPLLVLGSAHELFLRNQAGFDGTLTVLVPFWVVSGVAALSAWALFALSSRPWARAALWTYHATGAVFLVYSLLRARGFQGPLADRVLEGPGAVLLVLASLAVLTGALYRRDPKGSAPALAVFALVLMGQEGFRLTSRFDPQPPAGDAPSPVLPPADSTLPNVYHLVLDGFQAELFDRAWPTETPLEGFFQFPETRSFFGATAKSMASTFLSRRPRPHVPALDAAMDADESLLRRLRAEGYRLVGYLPKEVYPAQSSALDALVWNDVAMPRDEAAPVLSRLFWRLWLGVTLPYGVLDRPDDRTAFGLPTEQLRLLRSRRMSLLTQPVTALLSFERYLSQEAGLPSTGRYTIVHVLVPHIPFVLTSECRYPDIWAGTDGLAQHQCATLLMRRFLQHLEGLGRLRDSVVVIQSDHGSNVAWSEGAVVPTPWIPTLGDHPALLLIKPRQATAPLQRVPGSASLLDLAPTLLSALGLPSRPEYEGRPLLCSAPDSHAAVVAPCEDGAASGR